MFVSDFKYIKNEAKVYDELEPCSKNDAPIDGAQPIARGSDGLGTNRTLVVGIPVARQRPCRHTRE